MTPSLRSARLRRLGAGCLVATCAVLSAACDPKPATTAPLTAADSLVLAGRLSATYVTRTGAVQKGLSVQTVATGGRPFGLYVPSTYDSTRVWPVTVLLHGYGVSGEEMALDFQDYAEAAGEVVLAPNSFGTTWDLIQNSQFGADVQYMDGMLTWAFQHISVDPTRLSISGFSDGATYALWIGLKNGDLFTRVAAMTPCTALPQIRTGMPILFISHGKDDTVLPIDACSRVTVPALQADGYSVQYVEYPSAQGNGHFVTPDVLTEAMAWLAQQ